MRDLRNRERRRQRRYIGIVAPAATIALIFAGPGNAQVQLVNRTADVGLTAIHRPASEMFPGIQAFMIGGMAVGDFNNDGRQDLFWLCGGGDRDLLFLGNETGTFDEVSVDWGLTEFHAGCGAAVGDYDGDGWQDIFVTSFGVLGQKGQPGQNRLYRNSGNGSFDEVAQQAGVNFASQTAPGAYGACFGDYDLDGDLDLCVVLWGENLAGNRLYRNDGDGTFTDVTDEAFADGLVGVWGFQPAFVDMDGDLYPELLIAADFESSRYFVNNGDGTFTDQTGPSGTGLDDNGMGQTVGDFDNNGLFDWYVTSIHQDNPPKGHNIGNMLYLSLGNHSYQEVSVKAAVNDGGWGWGTVAVDLDHDAWVDIVEVNGRPAGEWLNERGKLFYNNRNGTFDEIAEAAGFDHLDEGRTIVKLDADNDGDQDLVVFTNDGPLHYYENQTQPSGAWLRITLDTANNPLLAPNGFGSRVTATVGKNAYHRYLNASPSYLGTSEWAVHFGLGEADTVDELRIVWSRGYVSILNNVPVNQNLQIQAPRLADLSADGIVGVIDLLMLLGHWGLVADSSQLVADINNDGGVGVVDLLMLLGDWG